MLLQPVDRAGSDSMKWGRYSGRDVLPLWVADMDFAAPPAVIEALHARIDHGVFGYTQAWPSLINATQRYLAEQYGWAIEADWLVWIPGLVSALNVACRATSGQVLTATPVYPPFFTAPRFSGVPVSTLDLRNTPDGWQWDWAALEAQAASVRQFFFCHPHNPVGRVWDDSELQRLAALAERHDWVVCSDEIHCDLILDADKHHRPFACVSDDAAQRSITLMAPSKTYNVPGLGCAFAVIPNAALRRRFESAMRGIVPHVSMLGWVACEAAFRDGGAWREELIETLRHHRDQLQAAVAAMPGVSMTHVQATYLAWIDARGLGVEDPAAYFESHGLGLSNGRDFGAPGWVRLNFGCAEATLNEALQRLDRACRAARR